MHILLLGILLGSIVTVPAIAGIYRCDQAGKTVYTDRPCGAGAEPHALPPLGRMPAGPQADLAGDAEAREARRLDRRARDEAKWQDQYAERKAVQARTESAVSRGRVLKGMRASEVRRSLGRPDRVERQDGRETWTYGTGKQRQTVVLEDGAVVRAPRASRR